MEKLDTERQATTSRLATLESDISWFKKLAFVGAGGGGASTLMHVYNVASSL